jgi:two-component system response regulator PilR (NtrC family)
VTQIPTIRTNRTLIVDDDDVIAFGLQEYLNLRGFETHSAPDYVTARRLMSRGRYAVALVDVVGTGDRPESGLEFVCWVRRSWPETVVVVLTAYRTDRVDEIALAAGIFHVLDKPKRFDEIVDLVLALGAEQLC